MANPDSIRSLFFSQNRALKAYKWEHYLDIYDQLLEPFAGKDVKILEIGVLGGGSLEIWKSFFGDKSEIYGIDIDEASRAYERNNIKIFIGNQCDENFLHSVIEQIGGVDIVIDDGAHTFASVTTSFEVLYPQTSKLYIIEDTHAMYWYSGFFSFGRDIFGLTLSKLNFAQKIRKISHLFFTGLVGSQFKRFVSRKMTEMTTAHHGNFVRKNPGGLNAASDQDRGISIFAKETESITAYDSMIVFKKNIDSEQAKVALVR